MFPEVSPVLIQSGWGAMPFPRRQCGVRRRALPQKTVWGAQTWSMASRALLKGAEGQQPVLTLTVTGHSFIS